jgi:hypothetical protein
MTLTRRPAYPEEGDEALDGRLGGRGRSCGKRGWRCPAQADRQKLRESPVPDVEGVGEDAIRIGAPPHGPFKVAHGPVGLTRGLRRRGRP